MSLRRFPAPPLSAAGQRVVLDPESSHHMLRVTRVPRGARVELFDGQRAAAARLVDVLDGQAVCELEAAPRQEAGTARRILVLAVLKGPAMEHALRMATELGATDIWPVSSARTVPKGDKAERWQRVLTGAARQCGRQGPPQLAALQSLETAVRGLPEAVCAVYGKPGAPVLGAQAGPAAVLIGPEGGWSPAEEALFEAAGLVGVGLGPHVLRADTAAAAGLALLG